MEEDILHIALENFTASCEFDLESNWASAHSDNQQDGYLAFKVAATTIHFKVEIKKRLSLSNLPPLYKKVKEQSNLLLIADYISKPARQHLKEQKISYLDTSGNAFITNHKGIFIYIETNSGSPYFHQQSNPAFSKTGLKVIFQFLLDEHMLHQSYRQIAGCAQVSLDTVSRVLKGLKKEGYIIEVDNQKLQLHQKERLIQEWVTLYNKVLRPKLKQKVFKAKNFSTLKNVASSMPFLIGGELAAEVLSNYLIAEKAIIYTSSPFIPTAKQLQLIPTTEKIGTVTLMEKFWKNPSSTTIAPAILVYADLLYNPTPRNLETAQIIYNKHVRDTI